MIAAPMPRVPPVTNCNARHALLLPEFFYNRRFDDLDISKNAFRRSALHALSTVHVRGLTALHAHRNAHAAADAQRGEALLGVAPLHLVEQRHQHARAGRADRMADRDRAAVDVDLVGVPAEILVDRAGLRGEGLVGFDQIEVGLAPAGLLQCRARGGDNVGLDLASAPNVSASANPPEHSDQAARADRILGHGLAQRLCLLGERRDLRLHEGRLQLRQFLDVLGARDLLRELERGRDVLSANAMAFSPICFALAWAPAACPSKAAAAFCAVAMKSSKAFLACSTLCSAWLRISIGISKFAIGFLNIVVFLAVMTALLRLPCCYGWIKWVPRLCARLEPPDNRRLRRGRLGPERQRSPREKAASVGATWDFISQFLSLPKIPSGPDSHCKTESSHH